MKTTPALAASVNQTAGRSGRRETSQSERMPASGARFGRMRIATADARPASGGPNAPPPSTTATPTAENAAAGTALIGAMAMNRTVGLLATIDAAPRPTVAPATLTPIANVARTSTPAVSGTIQKMAHGPAIALAAAIRIGSPGAY